MSRQIPRLTLLFGLLLNVAAVGATSPEHFNAERFQALHDRGEPILVEIAADWCPVCAAQEKVLEKLYTRDDIQRIHWFKLDWDAQRRAAKDMGAWRQSTLILFRDGREIDRLVAQTDTGVITGFLVEALED